MNEYKHVFSHTIPSENGQPSSTIIFTIDGEADLPQLLSCFEDYLIATGFVFNGDLCIAVDADSETPED